MTTALAPGFALAIRIMPSVSSSVHFHLSHEAPDKAAGTVRMLGEAFGEDATAARFRYAFVGDSGNDATAFAAFKLTFGVANVRAAGHALTRMPRFVAPSPMGRGFVEIAASLVGNPARLASLGAGLRERLRASPLLDPAGFTRELEALFREEWRRWCAGRGPGA